MDNVCLMMVGLCVFVIVISGCVSQTQEDQATGSGQQGALTPQDQPSGQRGPGQQGQNMQRGPPQEAIDACSGKSDNDTCAFTMGGNAVTGFCRSRPNGVLTCFRFNMGQGGMFRNGTQQGRRFGGGLPQEAVDACEGKPVNDTCEFRMNGTVVQGACMLRRSGNVTCVPPNMGQRPIPGSGGQVGQTQDQQPPAGRGINDNGAGSIGGN
jgi:hypothetical protein